MSDTTLLNNTAASRYELHLDGKLAALADYKAGADHLVFTHTEVLPGNEGKGLGSKLAKFALDDVRGRGLKAVPQCEFIAGWIAKHPDYQDLVKA